MSYIEWLLKAYIDFIVPIKEYIIVSEILISCNYILYLYTSKKKNNRKPLWLFIFGSYVLIISTRLFDLNFDDQIKLCDKASKSLCYYQLVLITKNVGLIFGYDIKKIIKNKDENN